MNRHLYAGHGQPYTLRERHAATFSTNVKARDAFRRKRLRYSRKRSRTNGARPTPGKNDRKTRRENHGTTESSANRTARNQISLRNKRRFTQRSPRRRQNQQRTRRSSIRAAQFRLQPQLSVR